MARVWFYNVSFHGHVNPTLPLLRELVRRGDEVTYFQRKVLPGGSKPRVRDIARMNSQLPLKPLARYPISSTWEALSLK